MENFKNLGNSIIRAWLEKNGEEVRMAKYKYLPEDWTLFSEESLIGQVIGVFLISNKEQFKSYQKNPGFKKLWMVPTLLVERQWDND